MRSQTQSTLLPEAAEPRPRTVSVPIWIFILMALLLYVGMFYVDHFGGAIGTSVQEPYGSAEEVVRIVSLTRPASNGPDLAEGERIFMVTCAPCHQASGMGAPGLAPPLAGSEWVQAPGPNRVVRIILDGLQGPIKVKGQDFALAMPAWKENLKDADIAAVASYVRGNPAWSHSSSPVTTAQVKAIRAKEAARAAQWTVDELTKVPEKD